MMARKKSRENGELAKIGKKMVLVKMFLNLNSEQLHALDAAKQAFGPMLEGLSEIFNSITLVTFVLGLIIALFTGH